MQRSRVLIYGAVLAAGLAYLSAWHAADHAPGVTPSAEGLMAPLDDAYIFGQYARQALRGEWLHYTPGAPISTGVSSWAWLLGLTALMGLGWPLTWAAWALGLACLAWSVRSLFKLSARLFPALPDWLLPLLFLAHASSVSFYFQGMDTGLLLASLFAAADASLDPRADRRFWATGMLLAFTRPEGQLALPFLALARAWPQDWKERARSAALALFLSALPTAGIWAISASPVPDSSRPKTAFMDSLSMEHRAVTAQGFAQDVTSTILLGLPFHGPVGEAGGPRAGNDPTKHFPLFSLLVVAFGLANAWRQQGLRAWWAALLGVWVLTFSILCWTLPVGWHRHRYLAALWPLMLLGLTACLHLLWRTRGLWARAGRSVILLAWLGFSLLTWPWFLQMTFQGAANYAGANREAAYQLKALPQAGRVAVEDAGLLAYYSGWETVDLLGVTDHQFALVQEQGAVGVFGELWRRQPLETGLVAVLHPQRNGSYSQLWTELGFVKPVKGLGNMVLYKFQASQKMGVKN